MKIKNVSKGHIGVGISQDDTLQLPVGEWVTLTELQQKKINLKTPTLAAMVEDGRLLVKADPIEVDPEEVPKFGKKV